MIATPLGVVPTVGGALSGRWSVHNLLQPKGSRDDEHEQGGEGDDDAEVAHGGPIGGKVACRPSGSYSPMACSPQAVQSRTGRYRAVIFMPWPDSEYSPMRLGMSWCVRERA